MSDLKNKVENTKDKVIGKTKEGAGRATGSQEMELKGKLQYQKGDLKDKAGNTKEKIAEKVNDTLDKK
ncbi:MAG: CsbD family protein [Clostridiaceae bacterium]|nr:CsbD family protein [Clostridiaceae bacterium]